MAETFLNEILQTTNSVQSDDQNRDCVICLQETGTMSRDTGLIEIQLRLPCQHVVGSGCITVWLKENNSCPLCRCEFFPAQRRPNFENDELEGEDEDDEDQEDENQVDFETRQVMFEDLCEDFCIQLGLDDATIQTAQNICQNISDRGVIFLIVSGVHDYAIVALAVYIASCAAGHARSPREICSVRDENDDSILETYGISCDNIREAYDTVYDRREELIDYHLKRLFELRGVLAWPSVGRARSDEQIERARDLLAAKRGCSKYCDQLQVVVPVDELSQHIAGNLINEGFHALGYPENSRISYVFPLEIAAASIYIASHLVGKPISRRAIQDLIEDELSTIRYRYRIGDIRSIYRTIRDRRDQLVDEVFRKSLALDLDWQSLDIDVGEDGGDGKYGDRRSGDTTREGQENNEEPAQGETIIYTLGSPVSRIQSVTGLCNDYCNRLSLSDGHRINVLGQEIAQHFTPLAVFANCRPESIAAACVYFVCCDMAENVTYQDLEAIAAVDVATIRESTLKLTINGMDEGGICVFDVINSTLRNHPRME